MWVSQTICVFPALVGRQPGLSCELDFLICFVCWSLKKKQRYQIPLNISRVPLTLSGADPLAKTLPCPIPDTTQRCSYISV